MEISPEGKKLQRDFRWNMINLALVLAGLGTLPFLLIEREKPKSAIAQKLTAAHSRSATNVIKAAAAAELAPPATVPARFLTWDESISSGVAGYRIMGGDYSRRYLTNIIFVGRTNKVPDPGWLYLEVCAFGDNAESPPAICQRLEIERANNRVTLTFVPRAGPNVIQASDDYRVWFNIATVIGETRTNLILSITNAKTFYRIAR